MDKTESIARKLHFIDYFMEQRPVPDDWDELSQAQRNKYLNYAGQVLEIAREE